jgi:hypothetical protein
MSEQRLLLILFGTVWAVVVMVTVLRYGEVPPVLWAVLPAGISSVRAAFKAGTSKARHRADQGDDEP